MIGVLILEASITTTEDDIFFVYLFVFCQREGLILHMNHLTDNSHKRSSLSCFMRNAVLLILSSAGGSRWSFLGNHIMRIKNVKG